MKFIALTLILSSFIGLGNTANAGLMERLAEAKRKADDSALEQSIGPFTRTSIKEITIDVPPDAKWLMIVTSIGDTKTSSTNPTKPGTQKIIVSLGNGPGSYEVRTYFVRSEKINGDQYEYIKTFKIENLDKRDMTYLLPSYMVASENSEIIALSKQITAGETTDKGKVKKINDYMMSNITYNLKGFLDGTFASKPYDAMTVLKEKISVCGGYANLFAALSRAAGVKTKIVNGDAMGMKGRELHAWNEVLIDGVWLPIDTTWNTAYKSYKYFLIPENFLGDHFTSKVMPY